MFVPPLNFPEKPEIEDYASLLESANKPHVKKYTDLKYDFDVKEVTFEESAMGKIHKELVTQNEELRNYAAQQKINRNFDKKQAKKDAPKKFLRDCTIAIISGVIGSIITTVYNNSGFSFMEFFEKIFH